MLEHEARDGSVERRIAQRHGLGAGAHETGAAGPFPCDRDLGRGRIDADDLGAQIGDPPCNLAFTAPDVEHALRARQVLVDEREELLLVLGIDAVGELVLPPSRVSLPGIARGHATACSASPRIGARNLPV